MSDGSASSDRTEAEDDFTLERKVGQRIHAFSNTISGHFYRRTELPFGIGLTEWRVLRAGLLNPGISQTEISVTEGLNVMNVSRAVAGLKRKGLLEVRPDPEDRRRTSLWATETGRAIGADIGARERRVYEHLFSVLNPDELEQLDKFLAQVNDHLHNAGLPDPPPATRDWKAIIDANLEADEPPDGAA